MQFSATSDQFILTALAQHNGTFVLAIDNDARITKIVGKSNLAVNFDAQAAIGQSIDLYFSKNSGLAKLFHDALNNQPQKITSCSESGHYFETQIIPFFDDQNNIYGALSFENDVTEREKMVLAQKEHEEKLEKLFQETDDGIYLLDTNFVIQRANKEATFIHQDEGPLEGHVCYQRIFGRDKPCEFCPVVKTFRTGQAAESTYYDEKFQMHLQLTSAPLFDPITGKLIGVYETFRDVSDTYQLEQSESQMRTIISGGNVPLAFADTEGNLTFVNTAFQTLTGYSESESLGRSITDCIYDAETIADPYFQSLRASFYAKEIHKHRQDLAIRLKNGEKRWVDFTASAVNDAEGNRIQIILILLDITARYQINQAMEEANEMAHIMLDTAPIGCALFDEEGTLFECNMNVAKMLGLETKQEYINRFFEFVPKYQPEGQLSSDKFVETLAAVLKTGFVRLEWTYRLLDGTLIPCDVWASRVKWKGKDAIVCYGQDMREYRKILAEVNEADKLAQVMLDTTPLGCILLDKDGKLINCNDAVCQMFDVPSKPEYFRRFAELVPEFQPDGQSTVVKFHENLKTILQKGSLQFEWMYKQSNGTLLPCEIIGFRIRRWDDDMIVCYSRDLREYQKMIADMREAEERIQIMLNTNPQSCILFELNRQPIDCSLQALELFGVKDKKELFDRFYDLAPEYQPDGQLSDELMHEMGKQALAKGYHRFEIMHQKLDGTPFPCEIALVPIKYQGHDVIASYALDLREHKEMLAKMRETDERSQIMLDANPLGCQFWDSKFNVIDCNMAAVNLFKLKNKQEFCHRFFELLPECQPDGQRSTKIVIKNLKATMETGYQRFESMHQLLDGTPIPCEITLIRIPTGNDYIICGYTRDLREQKEMLDKIHKANEYSQIMLDATPMACILIDRNGNNFACNMAAVRMFGFHSKQEYYERLSESIPEYQPDGRDSWEMRHERIERAFETGYQRYEWMLQNLDGTPLPCEVTYVRVLYEDNYVLAAYLRDLREYKEMLAQIRDAGELTQIMLDATPLGSSVWDENFRSIACNQEVVKMFELSSKREFQDRFFELVPKFQPDGQLSDEAVRERIKKTLEVGYQRFEFTQQLFDGTPVPCEVTLVRVPKGSGYNVCGYLRDLREHKAMLAKIHETNEYSRLMLDATPLGSSIWDKGLNHIDCNLEAVKLFNLSNKQEFIDRFFELMPEFQQDKQLSKEVILERVVMAFETGYQRFEHIHQSLDGTRIPCELTFVRVQCGSIFNVCGYIRDLREHKAILARLQEAIDRTQTMLDATPFACALFDKNRKMIDCNLEAVRMAGVSGKPKLRERLWGFSPEYQPNGRLSTEMRQEKFQAAFDTGYQHYEWLHQGPNGILCPTDVTLIRLKMGNEDIIAAYVRDIREIKQHEVKQKRDQLRMNALLELAQMTQQTEQEVIDYTIKAAVSLTDSTMGYAIQLDHLGTNEPIRSLHIDPSVTCQVSPAMNKLRSHTLSPLLTACIQTKKAVLHNDLDATSRHQLFPEGHYMVNSHMNAPIMDGDTLIGIIGVGNKEEHYTSTDATQLTLFAQGLGTLLNRRKFADHLEKAKIEAEKANKAKSDFLAHMSHEIRTPMNAVIGMAELALREEVPAAVYEQIATIKQSGQTLLAIINDILDFSKIESGKLEITRTDYLLASLINDVVSIIQMRTSDSHVRFAVNIDCNIPSVLYGDEIRIRQIMLNLLSNSIKYTDKGYVILDVTYEISTTDENVMNLILVVSDSGRGIKPEDMDHLFGDFVRLDVQKNKHIEGTGLGLAIVWGLVKAMDGQIEVQSEYGKGSTFTTTLPQTVRERTKIATVENAQDKRVLVYERRKIHSDSILRTLNNLGIECACVETNAEFKEALSSGNWSFVFIATSLYKGVEKQCIKSATDTSIVLIVGFGESIANPSLNILPLPAHSISIANILNGGHGGIMPGETSTVSSVRFTAPEATVLVVDDINTNLSVMEGLLLPYKMKVHLCKSGKEAIKAIAAKKYDMVLMDHMMPEMDGIETTAHIRAMKTDDPYYEHVPIIAVTANAISGSRAIFLKHGFNDFLSKPIDAIKLDDIMAKWTPKDKRKISDNSDLGNEVQETATAFSHPALPSFFTIARLNTQKGLTLSRGNLENYKRTLATFLRDGWTKIEQIKTALKTDHLPLYATYVHGIKSAAAYIGADELSRLAQALETAGNQEDLTYIQTYNPKFLSTLESLLHDIDTALKSDSRGERTTHADRMLLNAELVKLEKAIDNIDPSAIENAMNVIQPFTQAVDVGDTVKELLQHTLIGDYDEAISMIQLLLSHETTSPIS